MKNEGISRIVGRASLPGMFALLGVAAACGGSGGSAAGADPAPDPGVEAVPEEAVEMVGETPAETGGDPLTETVDDLPADAVAPGFSLSVDPALKPALASLPGPRPLARMVGQTGIAMDFVLGELILATDDDAKLAAFLGRWGGTEVDTVPGIGGQPAQHLVALDPAAADVAALIAEVRGKAPALAGSFTTSAEAASKLLAVALAEASRGGLAVSPNFVLPYDAIADGTTTEAPAGDDASYGPNAFAWPYMDTGSAQDIGVGRAWQALERAGRLGNRVRILVIDGGFAPSADFPAVRQVVGDWNVPNPGSCGGSACNWHGTMVTTAAMGRPDDGFGAAGPAGPVGELLAVPFETDFFALVFTLERIVTATLFGGARIVNMSFGFELDLGWDIAVKVACLGLCPSPSEILGSMTGTVAATGKLLFASAGNAQGGAPQKDVDNGGASPEGGTTIPCELPGVICVGGMAHGATALDPGSNFGSQVEGDSVDIYGPFWTFVGPDPDAPANAARLRAGTSFSSPFVAGVAALVWAADPSLSASQVWQFLRDTAHVGGVGTTGNPQRVNAFGAVARVLGGEPPTVTLSGPSAAALNREVAFTAVASDPEHGAGLCPPPACPLAWSPEPARTVGNTAYFRFAAAGEVTVTVTAEDAVGQADSDSRTVAVSNSAPVVAISQPTPGASVQQGVAIQLLGSATDLNEGPDPGPGPVACTWTSSVAGDAGFPKNGCDTTATFASTGPRTLTLSAADPQGLSATATVSLAVTPPPSNLPPVITTGALPPTNYNGGYAWDAPISVAAGATDPEGNNPISYAWRATSFRPNSTTVWAADVTVQGPAATAGLSWTPASHPALFGDFADFGIDCYDGQTVRLTLRATDGLGNTATKTLPDVKVFRCILI